MTKLCLIGALLGLIACQDFDSPSPGWADNLALIWANTLLEPNAPIVCTYLPPHGYYATCSVNTSSGIYALWCNADDPHNPYCEQKQ